MCGISHRFVGTVAVWVTSRHDYVTSAHCHVISVTFINGVSTSVVCSRRERESREWAPTHGPHTHTHTRRFVSSRRANPIIARRKLTSAQARRFGKLCAARLPVGRTTNPAVISLSVADISTLSHASQFCPAPSLRRPLSIHRLCSGM